VKRIWIMKSGEKIKIKDMTTKHIKNCIKLLKKYHSNKFSHILQFANTLQSEIAIETIENEIDDIVENGFNDEAKEYILSFKKELERRKYD